MPFEPNSAKLSMLPSPFKPHASRSICSSSSPPGTMVTGTRSLPDMLADQRGDQRARPFRAGAGGQHQDRDAGLLLDQRQQLARAGGPRGYRRPASSRRSSCTSAESFASSCSASSRRSSRISVLDRQPLLDVGRLDHIEQRDPAAGVARAQRGEAQRDAHLLGLVDDDKEDASRGDRRHAAIGSSLSLTALRNGRLASQPPSPRPGRQAKP